MKAFQAAVYRLVRQIPRGQVATYGQIAALLGYPRAARAVGQAMRDVPPYAATGSRPSMGRRNRGVSATGMLPWHRVVNAQGGISLRRNVGSMLTQRLLLEQEGVVVRRGRIRLPQYRWRGPGRTRPLAIAALERL